MDRKYGHRGYRDAEKQEKKEKSHDRKPPQSSPRGDQFGPRTPRMVGTVTRARCSNCGAVLTPGFDPNGQCPKCQFELHSCKQCRFFDSGAQFECTQPIPERITPRTTASSTNSAPPSKKTPLPLPTPNPRRLPRLLPHRAPTTPARLSRISSRSSRPRELLPPARICPLRSGIRAASAPWTAEYCHPARPRSGHLAPQALFSACAGTSPAPLARLIP